MPNFSGTWKVGFRVGLQARKALLARSQRNRFIRQRVPAPGVDALRAFIGIRISQNHILLFRSTCTAERSPLFHAKSFSGSLHRRSSCSFVGATSNSP